MESAILLHLQMISRRIADPKWKLLPSIGQIGNASSIRLSPPNTLQLLATASAEPGLKFYRETMFRCLLLVPILVALLGANAVVAPRNSRLGLEDNVPVQTKVVRRGVHRTPAPDLKVHIDTFDSPGLPNSCLGRPTLVGYITVSNVGNRPCRHPKLSTAFGYSQVSHGSGVLFQVSSVGPLPATLAPGGEIHMLVQSVGSQTNICNGQRAISEGYVEINEPACRRETNLRNNKATVSSAAISNPN
jgi:hypothetical protein